MISYLFRLIWWRPKVQDCTGGSWAQLIRELKPGQQPRAASRQSREEAS